ncbi:hypothetical protein QYE76_062252 [Lolium multiflorum]|uniref:CCHC-type domain-containing protein n=1 Tax=Lolium multiflorum TaxID=4521 RepID=A0AAD8W887_LOLMU|nr:hypothetical protein QYE76_062252 [Lolium multiflorum]
MPRRRVAVLASWHTSTTGLQVPDLPPTVGLRSGTIRLHWHSSPRCFLSGDGVLRSLFIKRSTSPSSAVCGVGELLVPRPDSCRWRIRWLKMKEMVISRCFASSVVVVGVGSTYPVIGNFPAVMGLAPIQGELGAAAAARHRQLLDLSKSSVGRRALQEKRIRHGFHLQQLLVIQGTYISYQSTTSGAAASAEAAALASASRMADPAIGGHLARARRPVKPVASAAPTPCPSSVAAAMAGGALPLHAALAPGAAGLPPLVPVQEMLKPGVPSLPPSPAADSRSLHLGGVVASGLWASLADEDADSDEEELAPMTPLATSSSLLSSDPAVLVEGLGSLSLSPLPVASDGPVEVSCADAMMPAPSLLWVASLGSDDDDDDEVLAPQTPLAGSVHVVQAAVEHCSGLCASVDALGDDDNWVQVGRGGRPGRSSREPSSELRKEGLDRSLAFKRWARGRCFRCLERDHQVSSCRAPFKCIRCRRPGHRERFCRARYPAARSCSPDARACSSDAHAPCQRRRSPPAQPRRPSASRSWVEVVCQSSLPAASPPRASPRRCEEFSGNVCFDSHLQCQFASLRLELAQLVANRVEEASRPLREEVASLKLLLASVGVPLEPTEVCSSGGKDLAIVLTSLPLSSAEQKSSMVEITPELHESCVDSSVVPELLKLGGGEVVPPSVVEVRDVVPFGDEAAKSGLLAPGGVVAREVQTGSVDEGFECCFGEFSPRALHASSSVLTTVVATDVVAPVVENLPELQDHCGKSSVVLPVELGLLEPLAVDIVPPPSPSESCELPSSVDSGGPSIRLPLFDREAMLARIDQAVFVKKLGGLLACLEAASPGSGEAIACLIADEASTGKIKKCADIDEKAIRREKPEELVKALAEAKANAVKLNLPHGCGQDQPTLLITSDQVMVSRGVIRERPRSTEEAREFIKAYSGDRAFAVNYVLVTNLSTGGRKGGWDIPEVA